MSKIQTRNCNYCGKEYTGQGKQFCSHRCADFSPFTVKERLLLNLDIRNLFDCWEWKGHKNKSGYGCIKIDGKEKLVHRVIWELTFGIIPEGMCCLHKCDNPPCSNLAHLYLGTYLDNARDKESRNRGNHARGESINLSILKENQVTEIIHLLKTQSIKSLMIKYDVSYGAISHIKNNYTWKHISRL